MSDELELLRRTAELAADFLDTLGERPVFPTTPVEELGAKLGGPLPVPDQRAIGGRLRAVLLIE